MDEEGIGEIIVRGDNITIGYFEDETRTKEKIIDGWLHTGDLGKIDDDGFLYIYGRNSNMIVLQNGKKVFPEEIELKLNRIDGIKESFVYEKDNKINAKIVYYKEYFNDMSDDEIYSNIMNSIKVENEALPIYKKINDIIVTSNELEKTITGKTKRNIEYEKLKKHNYEIADNQNNDTPFEKIKKILIDRLGNIEITENSSFALDLRADSLDMVEIYLLIEKEFDIKNDKEYRKRITKVEDLINIVK